MSELGPHLERLGLEQYLDAFLGEGFDTWETLLDIQETDFDALNVKLGHRRKLQRAIAEHRGIPYERVIAASTYESNVDSNKPAESPGGTTTTSQGPPSAETKRKYRRHPKPDDNAPERPPSAYVIFSNKVREEVKDQNLSFTQIAKLVGDRWQKLDASEKEPYEVQANSAKEKYNIQLSAYKKTDAYKEYLSYLADFKAKHGGTVDQKRPKLDPELSTGSVSTKSLEMAGELLIPAHGHIRGSSSGSMFPTVMASPATYQGQVLLQTHVASVSSRSSSPPVPPPTRENVRRGQLSTQSSLSEDGSTKRSDSDPLVRTASLSLSTPPSNTPPLLPGASPMSMSDYGLGQDTMRRRYPGGVQQPGPPLGSQISSQTYGQTLPSTSTSENSWRNRGPELRSYLDPGRPVPPPTFLTSGPPAGVISLPPLPITDSIAAQRTLPFPRSSPTTHQQLNFPLPSRGPDASTPYPPAQSPGHTPVPGSAQSPLDRSESDAADALAGLAGRSSSTPRPESAKSWEQRWLRR